MRGEGCCATVNKRKRKASLSSLVSATERRERASEWEESEKDKVTQLNSTNELSTELGARLKTRTCARDRARKRVYRTRTFQGAAAYRGEHRQLGNGVALAQVTVLAAASREHHSAQHSPSQHGICSQVSPSSVCTNRECMSREETCRAGDEHQMSPVVASCSGRDRGQGPGRSGADASNR
jgi:hypothetical protein